MGSKDIPIDRRVTIKSLGTAGVLGLAGCIGDGVGNGNGNGNGGATDSNGNGNGGATDRGDVETISVTGGGWPAEDSYLTIIYVNEYFEEVNRRLEENGIPYEIEYTWHSGGSVVGAVEAFYGVRDDTVDMAIDLPTYYGSEMALAGFINAPFIWPPGESAAANKSFNTMCQPGGMLSHYFEDLGQYNLIGGTPPGYNIFSQNKITSMDQLDGKVFRSGGGLMSKVIENLGGSPVETTAEEIYETLNSGTAAACILPGVAILDSSLYEVTDYKTSNLHLGGFPLNLSISASKFDNMPDEVSNTLMEVGTWTANRLQGRIETYIEENIFSNEEWFAEEEPPGDNQMYIHESPIQDEIHDAVRNIPEEFLDRQAEEGRNAEEFRSRWMELMEENGSYYPPTEN